MNHFIEGGYPVVPTDHAEDAALIDPRRTLATSDHSETPNGYPLENDEFGRCCC